MDYDFLNKRQNPERPRIVKKGYSPANYDIKITIRSNNAHSIKYFKLQIDDD